MDERRVAIIEAELILLELARQQGIEGPARFTLIKPGDPGYDESRPGSFTLRFSRPGEEDGDL